MLQIYANNAIQAVIVVVILFIFSVICAIFSPLGIGFVIFSIIRAKTKSATLRTVAFAFQIILAVFTFIIGLVIALLFSIQSFGFYGYSSGWIMSLAVISGVLFVVSIEIGVLIWQTIKLKRAGQKQFWK